MNADVVTHWGWSRPFGTVFAVEVRPTCDGRGWFELRCPDGCCVSRYARAELYASQEEATKAARAWVQGKVAAYTAALAGLVEPAPARTGGTGRPEGEG